MPFAQTGRVFLLRMDRFDSAGALPVGASFNKAWQKRLPQSTYL